MSKGKLREGGVKGAGRHIGLRPSGTELVVQGRFLTLKPSLSVCPWKYMLKVYQGLPLGYLGVTLVYVKHVFPHTYAQNSSDINIEQNKKIFS